MSGRGAENGVHGGKMPEETTSSKSDEGDDPAAMQIREYRRVHISALLPPLSLSLGVICMEIMTPLGRT